MDGDGPVTGVRSLVDVFPGALERNLDPRRLRSLLVRALLLSGAFVLLAGSPAGSTEAVTAQPVSFVTRDGALIHADLYGAGDHGVVLAHGGRFDKESWRQQVPHLVGAGFRVLAIDLRGYGESRAPAGSSPDEGDRHLDVLGAVEYLREAGATTVSVVGASMGGDYAAEAAEADPDEIDRLVLLAAGAYTPLVTTKARKLFIMSRDDVIGDNEPRLPRIRSRYEEASEPKELILLEGSAHAQYLFETDQGDRLMREILSFLSRP